MSETRVDRSGRIVCGRCGHTNEPNSIHCNYCTNVWNFSSEIKNSVLASAQYVTPRIDCLIANSPLSRAENVLVGITSAGAFEGSLRSAMLRIEGGRIELVARTEVVAGDTIISLANLEISKISSVHYSPLSIRDQFKSTIMKSATGGIGITIGLIILVVLSKSADHLHDRIVELISISFCISALFWFIPGLIRIKRNHISTLISTDYGSLACFVLPPGSDSLLTNSLVACGLQSSKVRQVDRAIDAQR